jgi:folylpolyglutamate synthase/dihydropteroate synthase
LLEKNVRPTRDVPPRAAELDAIVVVTGSIYVVGEAMRVLRNDSSRDGGESSSGDSDGK